MTADRKKTYHFTAKRACYIAAMTAILITCKEAISSLPNVELVTLLVCLFRVHFGVDTLFVIYIFAVVEGLIYGFHPLWWIPYLYVWTILWAVSHLLKKEDSPLAWAAMIGDIRSSVRSAVHPSLLRCRGLGRRSRLLSVRPQLRPDTLRRELLRRTGPLEAPEQRAGSRIQRLLLSPAKKPLPNGRGFFQ